MTTSPPSVPPSFDPALYLHSEEPNPPSESFFDELEALDFQRLEKIRNKVVIQHRSWNLSDVFRSDEDAGPDTPTKARKILHESQDHSLLYSEFILPSSPPVIKMPFISSPGASPNETQKRKNEQQSQSTEPKRQRIMGGFLDEDDEDEDDLAAFHDAQMRSQFELQEQLIEQEPVELPQITPKPTLEVRTTTAITSSTITSIAVSCDPPRRRTQAIQIKTCSGKTHTIPLKQTTTRVSYERLVASRSTTAPGRAQKCYYGIDIHSILDEAAKEGAQLEAARALADRAVQKSIETPLDDPRSKKLAGAMWTEKYRARKFTELIGDERIHRSVLRWLKGWEPIVFPGLAKSRPKKQGKNEDDGERVHRKVLLLCGPPGLGKTTLAHVCAKQAGYEILEINASDDRSRDVVKGRIRDALGTENVKGMNVEVGGRKVRKAGRPVCVVVDEVDGVVSGSGSGGEGGFMKALIDLVLLDQRNMARSSDPNAKSGHKRKGDKFRFLRPLILVCNDVYHPSLRPLRTSSIAEIIHVRQAPFENVVSRLKNILTLEGIPSDNDGVRRLCEASWGLSRKKSGGMKSSGTAEGDIRSVLVAAEWVAHKLRNESLSSLKLTRSWFEKRVLSGPAEGSFFKGLSRGGVRDIVDRVFLEGGGFPDAPVNSGSFQDPYDNSDRNVPLGVADLRKRHAINKLREMIDASGDQDRCASECFATYPLQSYQDDTFLSKPNAAYDWLYFHDTISSKVYTSQEWELTPYLSQSVIAFHHLFSSVGGKRISKNHDEDDEEEEHPFSGSRADFAAFEAQKQNRAILNGFQSSFSAPLLRLFRSTDSLITDLVPNLMRMLSPDVKPVVVRGSGEQRSVASVRKESERALVQAAVRVMAGLGVTFEKVRVEGEGGGHGGFAYRMEPPLDSLVAFSKVKGTLADTGSSMPVRYAVRQVLDQEYRKETTRKHSEALTSSKADKKNGKADGGNAGKNATLKDAPGIKRDFFGRIIQKPEPQSQTSDGIPMQNETSKAGRKVWITYHDGFSNAVRKPISLSELMAGL